MGLQKYTEDQIKKMSMIELANAILIDEKKEMNFLDLFEKVAEYKGFSQTEKDDLLARFYTDLNIDGRFTTLGSNMWGLKRWYPVDQTSEKSLAETRRREFEEEEDELLAEEIDEYDVDIDLEDDLEEDELYDEFDDLDYNIDDEN